MAMDHETREDMRRAQEKWERDLMDQLFSEWITEVRRIGELLGKDWLAADPAGDSWWRDYFNDGLTPAQAWRKEMDLSLPTEESE